MSARPPCAALASGVIALLFAIGASAQSPPQPVPRRIVSLAPSVTEVLFEAGLGARVVGVTSHCLFPREVSALSKVGGYLTPSYEAIVALRPDLIVTVPEHADLEPRLRALGFPILRLDHRSLDGIIRSIEQVGERGGAAPLAHRAADALRQRLGALERIAARPRPRVLTIIGRTEDFRQLTTAAPGTIYDDLIARAGGANVLTSRAASYPTLSIEGVIRLDPDVILEFSSGGAERTLRRQWDRLDAVTAVKAGRVFVFTDESLFVPGPRFVRFADTIARALRGGR